jgi:hypothetical protein
MGHSPTVDGDSSGLAGSLLVAACCVFVWVRKSNGHKSWMAYFATTMYALVLLGFPVALAGWILLVQFPPPSLRTETGQVNGSR